MSKLEDYYEYDPETGRLFHIKELKCTADDGTTNGIRYFGRNYQATHIMFKLMTGRWPERGMMMDHKDTNAFNNKWENLREATPAQNSSNRQSSGRWVNTEENLERGVYRVGNRYKAMVNNQNFGTYDTIEEATAVARAKRQELHGEFEHQP